MKKDKMPIRKLTINTIKINGVMDDRQTLLNDRLAEIPAGIVKEKWNTIKSIVYKISKEKLSTAVRKHENWFDTNSMELEELINNRNLVRNNMLLQEHKVCQSQ